METPHRAYFATGSRRQALWLFLCVLIALLPLAILRDFTPANELRYLSIADESLESDRWWAFTNHGIPYADKPPLYLWAVMGAKAITGSHHMWLLTLFSIIPAFITVLTMDRMTRREITEEFRVPAMAMLFSCGLFAGMTFVLRMDMLMTMFITLAFRRFWILYTASPNSPGLSFGSRLLFPLWVFLAVFSKGPMGILILLVSTTVWLALCGKLRSWTRYWGFYTWIPLILLCSIWFGAVLAEGGTGYLDNLLFHQTVGRAVDSFHHKAPVWYYLTSLPYTLLPWTFLIVGCIIVATVRRKKEGTPLEHFFLTIIISTLVLLSCISSKIQVYMLPAYPFMVYLAVMVCCRHVRSRYIALALLVPTILLAIAGLAAGTMWLTLPEENRRWWMLAAAAILIGGTSATVVGLYGTHPRLPRALLSLALTVLALVFAAGLTIPEFNADLGYGALTAKAREVSTRKGNVPIASWHISRGENMDVYMDGIPFTMLEESHTDSVLNLPERPIVVMTGWKYRDMLPAEREEWRVGRKHLIVYLKQTNEQDSTL